MVHYKQQETGEPEDLQGFSAERPPYGEGLKRKDIRYLSYYNNDRKSDHMMKKVVAAGHICLDITPAIPGKKVSQIQDMLSPGKLIHVGEADVHTGGSVANTGLAMKLLGADVSLAGKIGDDAFGDMVTKIARDYNAEKGLICSPGDSTSYSVVVAVPGIDRIFLHHPGANDTFTADDLSGELLEGCALLHFGYPSLMRRMYEDDGSELLKVIEKARSYGAAVSLDMAAVDPDSPAGKADWRGILTRVLPYVDIFVPSIEEICFMLDRDHFDRLKKRAGSRDLCEVLDLEEDIRPLAARCMEMGVKILLLKCGVPGMYLCTGDPAAMALLPAGLGLSAEDWAGKQFFERSYVPEKVLSGTGAGDTSIAAFLTAMLKGFSPEKCMQYAAAAGACCVEAYDALSGLKSLEEMEQKIRAGWQKNQLL